VVAQLAASAGIFHTKPRLVYVPASVRLGEFEIKFANTICLFEERPSGDGADPNFGYAAENVNSQRLFQKLTADADHRVDQHAFLKARLFDMWIGDWDRPAVLFELDRKHKHRQWGGYSPWKTKK